MRIIIICMLFFSKPVFGQSYDSAFIVKKYNYEKHVGQTIQNIFEDITVKKLIVKTRFFQPRIGYLSGCEIDLSNKTQLIIYSDKIHHQQRYSEKRQWSMELLKKEVITYIKLVDYSTDTIHTVIYTKGSVWVD